MSPISKNYIYTDDMVLGSTATRINTQPRIMGQQIRFRHQNIKNYADGIQKGWSKAEDLTKTKQEAALKEERQQKRNEVPNNFYTTDTMTDRSWTGPNNKIRSAWVSPQTLQKVNATAHISHMSINFLRHIFRERIISQQLWPLGSPHLTPPDYFFSGQGQNKVLFNGQQLSNSSTACGVVGIVGSGSTAYGVMGISSSGSTGCGVTAVGGSGSTDCGVADLGASISSSVGSSLSFRESSMEQAPLFSCKVFNLSIKPHYMFLQQTCFIS
ncbi:hypothetical protein ANN_21682 [Periplaneta americana]|uniref:Uncharacterized protein n=1 Tax=Periplaneta americana TaxID=6978 RepID=A0ABQ8S6E7_PERAM|nr:hypothetical protein ANN_21682 [Periplaneta americana]